MRFPSTPSVPGRRTVLLAVAALVLAAPVASSAQDAPPSASELRSLVKEAHDRQRDFEMFRQSRIPVEREREGGTCDARIGRICIWFGGDEEADFPPEAPEVGAARRDFIQLLARAAQGGDAWVVGQWVHYLAEDGRLGEAARAAEACGVEEAWWCSALLGYVRHLQEDFVAAEAAFRAALAAMPDKERQRWMAPRFILTGNEERDFNRGSAQERERRWETFWRLSDPLFLVEGNDRLTDHFARLVEARNMSDAENAQGLFWEEDLEETLIRYGRIMGYSRTHAPQAAGGMRPGGGFSMRDTRRVVGHHHPRSRGYLFPAEYLSSPSDIPPESWITAPREAHTWYAPPYAPDFRGLETQVGRFRRGDEMLVVGAFRPIAPADPGRPAPSLPAGLEAGLALVPEDGGDAVAVLGGEGEGVLTLLAPPGRYVSSLEVLDADRGRAWRARQGVKQEPLVPGLVAVSDLLILEEGAALPATLEEALPHVRRGVRIRRGERFAVVWEVYGLRVEQPARVTLGFTRGRPAFLERIGEFVGLLEPDRPVEVAFDVTGDDVQTAFRSVVLGLPELEPGAYTLHLRLELPGREPAITSRPIVVEG